MDAIQNLEYGEIRIAEILGRKSLSKGVKVDINEKGGFIDLYLIVDYGTKIPEVAWEIQDKVKRAIEVMTNLEVIEVNIHVQGVNFLKATAEEGKPQGTK